MTEVGDPLNTNDSACAAAVIADDPYCGSTYWDGVCVNSAAELCLTRYVTRTAVDTRYIWNGSWLIPRKRVMADTCVEAKIPGYPACPVEGSGPGGNECCMRSLVLKGVYRANTNTGGKGRIVEWYNYSDVSTPNGTQRIEATLVPDPCVERADGTYECQDDPHKLWQGAGFNGPAYPDCSGSSGPVPCNDTDYTDQDSDNTGTYYEIPSRATLVDAMTALITTDGSYQVDLRWSHGGQQILAHDPEFNSATLEGLWTFEQGTVFYGKWAPTQRWIKAKPVCYSDQSTQGRASGALVENILYCSEVDPINSYAHLAEVFWNPPADW
ncbi:MAG: hypothetical protein IPM54_00815 [Polyangiaceae bacterium]|nr:hypothetical protein [Polyangiaceae bacterium]